MEAIFLHFDRGFDFFLSSVHGDKTIRLAPNRRASIKDIIESFGVPHTEVGKILVNGVEVDFSNIPRNSEIITICSISTPFDITRKTRLRPHPFDTIRFVADVNVGKLAKLLLMLGFDTEYSNGFSDDTVAEIAFRNKRVVLTRDTSLLKRKKVTFAKRIRQERPESQLKEVLEYFGLDKGPFEFLSRCTTCNKKLQPIKKQTIVHRLEPKTRKYYDTFKICPGCCRIFWQGSHYEDMKNRFANDFLKPQHSAT